MIELLVIIALYVIGFISFVITTNKRLELHGEMLVDLIDTLKMAHNVVKSQGEMIKTLRGLSIAITNNVNGNTHNIEQIVIAVNQLSFKVNQHEILHTQTKRTIH